MNKFNYYKSELEKLNTDSTYRPTIKIWDGEGNETKSMDLNLESIPELIKFLESYKEKLK